MNYMECRAVTIEARNINYNSRETVHHVSREVGSIFQIPFLSIPAPTFSKPLLLCPFSLPNWTGD